MGRTTLTKTWSITSTVNSDGTWTDKKGSHCFMEPDAVTSAHTHSLVIWWQWQQQPFEWTTWDAVVQRLTVMEINEKLRDKDLPSIPKTGYRLRQHLWCCRKNKLTRTERQYENTKTRSKPSVHWKPPALQKYVPCAPISARIGGLSRWCPLLVAMAIGWCSAACRYWLVRHRKCWLYGCVLMPLVDN